MKLDNFGKASLSFIATIALVGIGAQSGSAILLVLGAATAASTIFFGLKFKKEI